MQKLIVSNWKMNGSLSFIKDFIPAIAPFLSESPHKSLICPPFGYLTAVREALKNLPTNLGAQNCHTSEKGSFTGEMSAVMLADLGCSSVILGHSERRTLFGETDRLVKEKASAAHTAALNSIICIGETWEDKDAGQTLEVIIKQITASLPVTATPLNTILAYEPIWAIGTGLTPTIENIASIHHAISQCVPYPILYGGSVTGDNAKEIMSLPHVDGVLVGGASLKVEDMRLMFKG